MGKLSEVTALDWVRSQPTRFFNSDPPKAVHLLAYVMADIVALTRGDCIVRRRDDWYVIGSDVNWIEHEAFTVSELFRNVVTAPAHGQHSMRGEILVSAFAKDVAVVNGNDVFVVQGVPPPMDVASGASAIRHAIAFRM